MDENNYINYDRKWNCLKLIEHSKQFPVFDMPLICVDLSNFTWSDKMDISTFIFHMKRIENTNLDYPIILDDRGYIADGWHRVCKAIIKGDTTIKAVRLETMPEPDEIYKK